MGNGENGAWLVFLLVVPPSDPSSGQVSFVVGADARRNVHGFNRPFRIEDFLCWRLPSRIPEAWSFPSGQDDLVRRFSRWPVGLEFALVWAPLRRCPVLVLATLQQHVNFAFALSRWRFWLALPRPWQCLGWRVRALALSRRRFDFTSALGLVRPCALDINAYINASGLAAAAFSASPAGSTPALSPARAGAAPTTGSAPPRSCALTFEGPRFLTSVFSAIGAGPRGSWITGTLRGSKTFTYHARGASCMLPHQPLKYFPHFHPHPYLLRRYLTRIRRVEKALSPNGAPPTSTLNAGSRPTCRAEKALPSSGAPPKPVAPIPGNHPIRMKSCRNQGERC